MTDLRALETPLPQSQPPPREEHRERVPGWFARRLPNPDNLSEVHEDGAAASSQLHVLHRVALLCDWSASRRWYLVAAMARDCDIEGASPGRRFHALGSVER